MHNMIDDVTKQLLTKQGRLLSPSLYDALDAAQSMTASALKRHTRFEHPHLWALHLRADLRHELNLMDLPDGWEVRGNSRMTEQLFLHHPDSACGLRMLSESTVNPGGVPHAGSTLSRQQQWSLDPKTNADGMMTNRSMLLLVKAIPNSPSFRIVHPVSPGRYQGKVKCDFQVPLLRDVAAMPTDFPKSDEYSDLFEVTIEDVGTDE